MCARYKVIAFPLSSSVPDTAESCRQILELTNLQHWAVGNTKVTRLAVQIVNLLLCGRTLLQLLCLISNLDLIGR